MSERPGYTEAISTAPMVTLTSEGRCLVIGGSAAADAAVSLSQDLDVTLCLTEPLPGPAIPVIAGTVSSARGGFGDFVIIVRPFDPDSARHTIETDIVVDISGGRSLFPGCGERDGYLRAPPTDADAIQDAIASARGLVGEFEKPLHVAFTAALCAHSRNGKTGCTRCLDVCPAGAITPAGDHVSVDAGICEGCGSCAGTCPTGALAATMPSSAELLNGVRNSLRADRAEAILLLHETGQGAELASAVREFHSGATQAVEADSVLRLGHEVLLGLIASGARAVAVLAPPRHRDHLDASEAQVGIANAILAGLGYGEQRIMLLAEDDPEIIAERLRQLPPPCAKPNSFGLVGSKREVSTNILAALHEVAPSPVTEIRLPRGAPYGAVILDDHRCTLCLACVSVCPEHALQDCREHPELRFDEAACVQCGLCVATCPEQALSLSPRIDFTAARGRARTLKAEAAFACRSCGKPFGTKSAIERVKQRIAGNPHFAGAGRLELVEMCGDCRVRHFMSGRQPMAGAERARVMTSEDYIVAAADAPDV